MYLPKIEPNLPEIEPKIYKLLKYEIYKLCLFPTQKYSLIRYLALEQLNKSYGVSPKSTNCVTTSP